MSREFHLRCRSWRKMSASLACAAARYWLPLSQMGHARLSVPAHVICIAFASLCPRVPQCDPAKRGIKSFNIKAGPHPCLETQMRGPRIRWSCGAAVRHMEDTHAWIQNTHHREARVRRDCKKWKKKKKKETWEERSGKSQGGTLRRHVFILEERRRGTLTPHRFREITDSWLDGETPTNLKYLYKSPSSLPQKQEDNNGNTHVHALCGDAHSDTHRSHIITCNDACMNIIPNAHIDTLDRYLLKHAGSCV